jgi:hypothetical protein
VRAIEGIPADRAKLRTTLAYSLRDDLQVGLEWNPLAGDTGDMGPIANWRAWDETHDRPALILGTSSDRIGTSHGRAVYATLSKDLEHATGLPIAPYAGVAYGTFDEELAPIGGLVVRWRERFSTTHLYDGENLHHMATLAVGGGRTLGVVAAEQDGRYYFGLTFSTGLGGG